MRAFLKLNGLCQICGTNFVTASRLMRHLSDKRRPTCAKALLAGAVQPTGAEELASIRLADRRALKEARAQGHSHELAQMEATRSDGTVVGRVQM